MDHTPPPAASDLGPTDWERQLIRVIRRRHFTWRTEETYHGWAVRFSTEGSNYSLDIIGVDNNISAYRANYVWNIPGRFTMQ
jgi:hypothetical protein